MKSCKDSITNFIFLPLLACTTFAHGQDLIGIPEACADGGDQITTPDGRIFVCSLESGSFEDFTPPTGEAIWPISIGPAYAPPSVTEQRPRHWDFRAVLVIKPSGATRVIEFDKHANAVSIEESSPTPIHLSEVYFHGVKIWPHTAVFYEVSDTDGIPAFFADTGAYSTFRNEVANSGFVVAGENICPGSIDGGSLWYQVHNPNEIALMGSCSRATTRATGSDRANFYYYPGFDNTIPVNQQLHWTFQRHSDPLRPLRDAEGNCHLYCKGEGLLPSKGEAPAPRWGTP